VIGALALVTAACGRPSPPPPIGTQLAGALATALAAADHARAPWRCAALDAPALADETLATGPRRWQLGGHAVRRLDDDRELVIGVIADAGGAAPTTIATLRALRGRFDAATADVVLALGGMGATPAELEATLGVLADHATFPVIALPGDLEPTRGLATAIATLRSRGDVVVDGRLGRWIELPGATIGTIPGAGATVRLVAGAEGCGWRSDEVVQVFAALAARPGLRIAATAEAPRAIADGEPTGELALVPAATAPIDIVLAGPTPAGATPAHAGDRDGHHIALSPGTADATPRLDARTTRTAGVLVIRGTAWSWRPVVEK
jgi:hypothetical protein